MVIVTRPALARVGVLALQGDFAAHMRVFREMEVDAAEVRKLSQLDELDGLVIPGGESTTLLKLLGDEGMVSLRAFAERGGAILGTCAGLILLAREARSPNQASLGLLDVVVVRNGFGRQVDSFTATGAWVNGGPELPLEMVFIRAPRIIEVGDGVEVIGRYDGEPVLVRQGRMLGATFHPELSSDRCVHEAFVNAARRGSS